MNNTPRTDAVKGDPTKSIYALAEALEKENAAYRAIIRTVYLAQIGQLTEEEEQEHAMQIAAMGRQLINDIK